jgi:hypothetical protein
MMGKFMIGDSPSPMGDLVNELVDFPDIPPTFIKLVYQAVQSFFRL